MISTWSEWKRYPRLGRGENLEAPISPGIYEVRYAGTGALHSFAEVVSEIRRLLPMADITVSEPAGNIVSYLERSQPFDISRARSRLGFAPRFTLASGLADYVAELQTFAARYRTLD